MMFGIETYQFISFLRQLGLAVSGAACLWGIVFLLLSRRSAGNETYSIIMEWISRRLAWLIYGGGVLAVLAWIGLLSLGSVSAHEGITLITQFDEVFTAGKQMTVIYALLTLTLLAGLISKRFRHKVVGRMPVFYLINFILISIAISYYTDLTALPLADAVFHVFHGFHSIFTLGTVLTLDFMFLSSRSSTVLQQHIFPLFPQISKVVWVGLSLDLFSVLLIYPDAVILSPRFFFAQTVVGILIINGVLLAGAITRRILAHIEAGERTLSHRLGFIASLCGTISVTSWMSITFVDFYPYITLSYPHLITIYVSIIIILFIIHSIWEHLDTSGRDVVIAQA